MEPPINSIYFSSDIFFRKSIVGHYESLSDSQSSNHSAYYEKSSTLYGELKHSPKTTT